MDSKRVEWLKQNGPKLLSELIRFDTTNPPGNETPLAEFVCRWFESFDLPCQVIESSAGRGNAIMTWQGREPGNGTGLLSHLDVVPAQGREWTHPPFSGEIADGCVWGRGALDDKGMLCAQMLAVAALKQEGFTPRHEITLMTTADEEAGGVWGIRWLLENRPELFDSIALAINEGGGMSLALPRANLFLLGTAERGNCWLRLATEGGGGHGSLFRTDSPVNRMLFALNDLYKIRMGIRLPKTMVKTANALLRYAGIAGTLEMVRRYRRETKEVPIPRTSNGSSSMKVHIPRRLGIMRRMLSHSLNVTGLKGYERPNVIPNRVEATVDIRILPGTEPNMVIERVRAAASKWRVKVEVIEAQRGFEFEPDKRFTGALRDALREVVPQAELAPFMLPASSDSKFLVRAGIKTYGFFPLRPKQSLLPLTELIHGTNERIEIEDLLFAARVYYRLLKRVAS